MTYLCSRSVVIVATTGPMHCSRRMLHPPISVPWLRAVPAESSCSPRLSWDQSAHGVLHVCETLTSDLSETTVLLDGGRLLTYWVQLRIDTAPFIPQT